MDIEVLKQNLIQLDYPNINTLNDVQVAELFNKPNRVFFLSWVLKKLYNITINEKNPRRQEIMLGDYMYECGFCTSTQKSKFVDCSLDILEQLLIFKKIFDFMLMPTSEEDCGESLLNDMSSFANLDLNLFPEYGNIKTTSKKDKISNLEKYNAEVEILKEKIANISVEVPEVVLDRSNEVLEEAEFKFKDAVNYIQEESLKLFGCRAEIQKNEFKFSESFLNMLDTDEEKLRFVKRHLQCVEGLNEFMDNKNKPETPNYKEDDLTIIMNLQKKSITLANLMKDTNSR